MHNLLQMKFCSEHPQLMFGCHAFHSHIRFYNLGWGILTLKLGLQLRFSNTLLHKMVNFQHGRIYHLLPLCLIPNNIINKIRADPLKVLSSYFIHIAFNIPHKWPIYYTLIVDEIRFHVRSDRFGMQFSGFAKSILEYISKFGCIHDLRVEIDSEPRENFNVHAFGVPNLHHFDHNNITRAFVTAQKPFEQ